MHLVDELGIVITAYQPHCQSKTENNLRQRHRILEKLCGLCKEVCEAEQIIDSVGSKGQQ
jgi:hypothetical protein